MDMRMLAFVASCLTFGVVEVSTHLVVLILMVLLFIMMTLTGESVPVAMPFLMMVMVLLLVTAAAAVTLTFDFCSDFFHSFLDTGICNLLCDVGGISQLLLALPDSRLCRLLSLLKFLFDHLFCFLLRAGFCLVNS
eukprot:COSAG05_NODE_3139_length_2292_cov_1.995440_3_plen_136_part_00